ncbi:glucosamine-6-phosphate deaminase [Kordiimonas sp.]|uniref:glucosamine-6-phosphate deaminase n=1 Tax=Kordiimonas sp. TaxID=1970157 RepID=UPI003A94CBFE
MRVHIHDTTEAMSVAAAKHAADSIRQAIADRGHAAIVLATGASQFGMLENLTAAPDIDWSAVTAYHLDEYCGVDREHPVSFRRYMRERFTDQVPTLKRFIWINADEEDLGAEINRLNADIAANRIDVACIGIGENGHLAFNEPPADFEATSPYLLVKLDDVSRQQQVGEGWFSSLDDVPETAISMSLQQILKSKRLIVTVPDSRKAAAVGAALEGAIDRACPASVLRVHQDVSVYLDAPAASKLRYFST